MTTHAHPLILSPSPGPPTRRIVNASPTTAPILIATDDPILTDTLGEILENERIYSTAAHDPASIGRDVSELLPRALLLDSRFLKETTLVICRRLRRNQATSELPIIVITSPENVTARVQAL